MATKKINVRVPTTEGLQLYRRAGFTFQRGADNVIEVDEKQLAALEADKSIAIGEPPKPKPQKGEKPEKPVEDDKGSGDKGGEKK
jgi:hypothetical protein